jgi:hypothetical protein
MFVCTPKAVEIFSKVSVDSVTIKAATVDYRVLLWPSHLFLDVRWCIQNFRTGRLKRELQMVQLSATRCSCIAILWVSLASFATITLYVASKRVFIVYFFIDSVRKLLDTPSYRAFTGSAPVFMRLVTILKYYFSRRIRWTTGYHTRFQVRSWPLPLTSKIKTSNKSVIIATATHLKMGLEQTAETSCILNISQVISIGTHSFGIKWMVTPTCQDHKMFVLRKVSKQVDMLIIILHHIASSIATRTV